MNEFMDCLLNGLFVCILILLLNDIFECNSDNCILGEIDCDL